MNLGYIKHYLYKDPLCLYVPCATMTNNLENYTMDTPVKTIYPLLK